MSLQGVPLDVSEVSWTIPDLIKALQTFSPLQSKNAAERCAIEASFKKHFPKNRFHDENVELVFLPSNDVKEVFGYPKEQMKGFLDARNLKNLKLSFKNSKSPEFVPIKWVATSPPTKHALGDPGKWIDSADTAAETNAGDRAAEDSSDVADLAKELLTLREDLKILVLALSRQTSFRKAEANARLAALVDAVTPVGNSDDASAENEPTTHQTAPRYMQVLEHAEKIVRGFAESKDASNSPQEFMSLLEAQLLIRELSKKLVTKEQELNSKQQELEEKDLVIGELRESVESLTNKLNGTAAVPEILAIVKTPPTPTVATTMDSVSGILGKIRRTSGSFFNPILGSPSPATTSAETGIQSLGGQTVPNFCSSSKKAPEPAPALAESANPNPEGCPDDPSASVTACSDWFQSVETYDFFISYRVATDAHTAMELYFRLKDQRISDQYGKTRQVKVYWDKECLKKGRDWHDGFVQGLKNSRCVLMLMSPGTLEGFRTSNAKMDNVLLEWETAILAARKYLCVAQPVFISDSANHVNALDLISDYIWSDDCPKLQPGKSKTQQLSAFTTLSAAMNLQGVPLDVSEVSWTIPDLIKALQNFSPLQSKDAAERCAIEASFKKYFPKDNFHDENLSLEFLTSNDVKEVFGYPKEQKKGFLDARKLTDLKLSFKKFPSMSKLSMEVLAHGLSQDFSFLTELNLKCVNIEKKSTWDLLASALKVNKSLTKLDLTENDITGIPALHYAIRDHPNLTKVLVGSGFSPIPLLRRTKLVSYSCWSCTRIGLKIFEDVWNVGKPEIRKLAFYSTLESMRDEEVPAGLGQMLQLVGGLESLIIVTDTPSFLDAVVECVKGSRTISSIDVERANEGVPAVTVGKRSMDKKAKGVKNNKVAPAKKQAAPWMKAFCDALISRTVGEFSQIAEISFCKMGLCDEDFNLMVDVLPNLASSLTTFRIDSNSIAPATASSIFKAIGTKDSVLEVFSASDNNIDSSCAEPIKDMITNCAKLASFALSKNPLGEKVIVAICEGISSKKTNMGDVGVKAIASLLTHERMALEKLDISENDLSEHGIRELGNALKRMTAPTLQTVDLHDCGNGPEGFETIADALKSPQCSVAILNVINCRLGDVGVALFLDHVMASKNISVDWSENGIKGTSQFTDVVFPRIRNGDITSLNLSGNESLTVDFMMRLAELLSQTGLEASKNRADGIEAKWAEVSAQRATKMGSMPAESDSQPSSEYNEQDDSEWLPDSKEVVESFWFYSGFVSLHLMGTNCGLDGAKAILAAIPNWSDFTINLINCGLDDRVVDVLIERISTKPCSMRGSILLDS
ncbi:NLR, CARD domain-containing protein 3 [Podochytrium sp. JEL0797]|nr:NLR, CARD domain-containing protein 3 [Podochytrium sp. JEL0797]